jgi:hypothetical protein
MATKNGIKNPTMSDNSKNWNVITGCDKYSAGWDVHRFEKSIRPGQ